MTIEQREGALFRSSFEPADILAGSKIDQYLAFRTMLGHGIRDKRVPPVGKPPFVPQKFHEMVASSAIGDEIDIDRAVPRIITVHRPASDKDRQRIPLTLATSLHPTEYLDQFLS